MVMVFFVMIIKFLDLKKGWVIIFVLVLSFFILLVMVNCFIVCINMVVMFRWVKVGWIKSRFINLVLL